MKTWNTLYKQGSDGTVNEWTISADKNIMQVVYGGVGQKLITTRKPIQGKNIGRANETSPEEQCIYECESKWKHKLDKGYTCVKTGIARGFFRPMLAQTMKTNSYNPVLIVGFQPKYNGVRCMAYRNYDNKIVLQSRNGKDYAPVCKRIARAVDKILYDSCEALDGEIYLHGMSFQTILSGVKKYHVGITNKLEFHVFDTPAHAPFIDRYHLIKHFISRRNYMPIVKQVPLILDKFELYEKYHHKFIYEGYEGLIVRDLKSGYRSGARVKALLKYKKFQDKEVRIIGAFQGEGIEAGCVVWEVIDEFGNIFKSRPTGTHEERRKLYQNRYRYYGKQLTIRYQELSKDNVPIFNVGIAIRDYE